MSIIAVDGPPNVAILLQASEQATNSVNKLAKRPSMREDFTKTFLYSQQLLGFI